jgi:hypothetical protein
MLVSCSLLTFSIHSLLAVAVAVFRLEGYRCIVYCLLVTGGPHYFCQKERKTHLNLEFASLQLVPVV